VGGAKFDPAVTRPRLVVEEAARLVGLDARGDLRFVKSCAQLFAQLFTRQEREFPIEPGVHNRGRIAARDHEGGHKDVGIDDGAHQRCSLLI